MFWRFTLGILLSLSVRAHADESPYPNGSFYYIILDNFQKERDDELETLAVSKFKSEIEARGYKLVFINGGDITSLKNAAHDAQTSVIVISGHGSDTGEVTKGLFANARIRSIFRSGNVSRKLNRVVFGTCYSACVAEQWDLRKNKIIPHSFGHFPIGVEWFQHYLTSPQFLSELGPKLRGSVAGTPFETFRTGLRTSKTVNELRDAISTYKKLPEFDPHFDAARIRESVYQELKLKPELTVNARDFQTAANLDLSADTMGELLLRFSRSRPSLREATTALSLMDKALAKAPEERKTSAAHAASELAHSVVTTDGHEKGLSLLKQIKDEELRAAFGFSLLKDAKSAREHLNVLKQLPDSTAAGTLHMLLKLKPTSDEILESLRHIPTGVLARNNLRLVLSQTKDPDTSLALFRGFLDLAETKSDFEIFDRHLTEFFLTQPEPRHYRLASELCATALCRDFVARNFVSQAKSPEELFAIAKEIRSGQFFLDPRTEIALQSRASALKTKVPAAIFRTRATEAMNQCQTLFARIAETARRFAYSRKRNY